MIDKTNLPPCPVETTLMLIGDKWKVLILRDLRSGTKRFGELKKSVTGISQKVQFLYTPGCFPYLVLSSLPPVLCTHYFKTCDKRSVYLDNYVIVKMAYLVF